MEPNHSDWIDLSAHAASVSARAIARGVFDAEAQENDLFKEACVKFPTAAYAVLECKIDSWADLRPRCAKLVHMARPRDLDPELGPEG